MIEDPNAEHDLSETILCPASMTLPVPGATAAQLHCYEPYDHDGDHYDVMANMAWDKDPDEYTENDVRVMRESEESRGGLAGETCRCVLVCRRLFPRRSLRCTRTDVEHSDDHHEGLPVAHYDARRGVAWDAAGRVFYPGGRSVLSRALSAVAHMAAAVIGISWI